VTYAEIPFPLRLEFPKANHAYGVDPRRREHYSLREARYDALGAAIEARLAVGRVVIELVLDAADGAGASWLHRHTEVIRKTVDQESGRVAMTVRAEPGKANAVRERFSLPSPLVGEG